MLTKEQEEILTGLLLGDGFLEKHKDGKNACLRIARTRTDSAYIDYHLMIFNNLGAKRADRQFFDKRTQKTYFNSQLRTPVNLIFTEWHTKWYINKIKSIPQDLKLTPTILATWFADDGSVIIKTGLYDIKLATHGFTNAEVLKLQTLLNDTFSLNFKIYQDNSGKQPQWTLRLISKAEVKKFVGIIDPVFPKGMDRKANKWRENMHLLAEKIYPACKFCQSEQVSKNGSNASGKQKYMCKLCKKQFI